MTAKYQPTDLDRSKVRQLAAFGVGQDEISKIIGISHMTLRKYYRHELDVAEAEANAQVAGWLFSKCREGNVTAMIFWMKTRAHWREVERHEHTGADGGAVAISVVTGVPRLVDAAGAETVEGELIDADD